MTGTKYFSILILFCGCAEYYFDKPQPIGKTDLPQTPIAIRGTWLAVQVAGGNMFDTLLVEPTMFITLDHQVLRYQKDDTASINSYTRSVDSDRERNKKKGITKTISKEVKGDTCYINSRTKTTYALSKGSKIHLREFDSSWVVSLPHEKHSDFQVVILRLKGQDQLQLMVPGFFYSSPEQKANDTANHINYRDSAIRYSAISKVDTGRYCSSESDYIFKPVNETEFRNLVKAGLFKTMETYIRAK